MLVYEYVCLLNQVNLLKINEISAKLTVIIFLELTFRTWEM